MIYLKISALYLVAVLLQILLPIVLPFYHWLSVEWLLIAVVITGFRFPWPIALKLGMAAGLLLDLCSGGRLGVYALSYMTIALLISVPRNWTDQERVMAMGVLVFLATILACTINYVILSLFVAYPSFFGSLLWVRVLPQAVINAVCVWPVYRMFPRQPSRRRGYLM